MVDRGMEGFGRPGNRGFTTDDAYRRSACVEDSLPELTGLDCMVTSIYMYVGGIRGRNGESISCPLGAAL